MAALEVAERDCRILLSTNCAALDGRALEVMARYCLKASHEGATFILNPGRLSFRARQRRQHNVADVALAGWEHAKPP